MTLDADFYTIDTGARRVLDHGFVRLVEAHGSDEAIIEAARQSTQKGFQGWGVEEECDNCHGTGREPGFGPKHNCRTCGGDHGGKGRRVNKPGDEKLLRFLWENAHSTPFEFAGAVFEVQAPIFVFREWHRHRTQSYSEASARYAPLPDLNYMPTIERCMLNNRGPNRQAGAAAGAVELTEDNVKLFQSWLTLAYAKAEGIYEDALKMGIPKELARVVLPVGRYSRMRASANLRNWLAFLTLREAPNAQWEIRQYANEVHALLKDHFPRTLALFEERQQ